jgi:hypothetical protein
MLSRETRNAGSIHFRSSSQVVETVHLTMAEQLFPSPQTEAEQMISSEPALDICLNLY